VAGVCRKSDRGSKISGRGHHAALRRLRYRITVSNRRAENIACLSATFGLLFGRRLTASSAILPAPSTLIPCHALHSIYLPECPCRGVRAQRGRDAHPDGHPLW
jgi:hypothetical protein